MNVSRVIPSALGVALLSVAWICSAADRGTAAAVTGTPIASGFLFVEGQYVPPPYLFRSDSGTSTVNGLVLEGYQLSDERKNQNGRQRVKKREARLWRKLVQEMSQGAIVVLFAGERPLVFYEWGDGSELLKLLSGTRTGEPAEGQVIEKLGAEIGRETFLRWLKGFRPSPDFMARAEEVIARVEASRAASEAQIAAVRRLDGYAYPLSVTGMILVALSLGHLLSHRPLADAEGKGAAVAGVAARGVCISLLLVLLMCGLDLIWTILASQAGAMRELNPLGSQMIESPQQLVLFKLSVTLIAVGLLFSLRRVSFTQCASWWMCLVCMLLSARWLTLNSMFVTE